MSTPTVDGIFASALGTEYTDVETARLEVLISEENGRAGLQVATQRAIVPHDLDARRLCRPVNVRRVIACPHLRHL